MSTGEQVARLEALLARVHSRRDVARGIAGDGASEAATAADVTPGATAAYPGLPSAAPSPAAPETPPPASVIPDSGELVSASPRTVPPGDAKAELDVEVMTEGTAEVDLDSIEADELAAASLDDSVADLSVTPEEEEEAEAKSQELPVSSRRAIPLEPLPDLAFDEAADTNTSHVAPPESGRQVALPATDFEGELSGVRPLVEAVQASAALEARASERPPPAGLQAGVPAVSPPVPLRAEITQADLRVVEPVAVFRGAAPEFKPQTFGELLDATLAL